jgi:hypothetical protein
LKPRDFPLDVPNSFAKILYGIAFLACSPEVFDGVAGAKVEVLGNSDALNPRRVSGVMWRVVDWVRHAHNLA